jgi:hypothetical protein
MQLEFPDLRRNNLPDVPPLDKVHYEVFEGVPRPRRNTVRCAGVSHFMIPQRRDYAVGTASV